ncbi:alpha-tocopherol transfer protein-like [Parasteatoda tepidariorum]|uniref:alpha-tocopherol transfer protein-like n=1 Tax=Parasteatoda tepidariorum TaxID=114398 RepID=UPI00077FD6F0|nr:alpha-tocopherol transfer protein-like [Parasteatoda tepidariorum]
MSLLPVWFKGLTPELIKKAEEELNEKPNIKAKVLVEFRRLINDEQDLYSRLDENFLLRFLRAKKFNAKKAIKVLRNYYNFKARHAGVFTNLKPSQVRSIMEMNMIYYSPYRVPDGSHIAICRLGSYNPRLAKAEELVATVFICAEMILECEASQISGGIVVFDFLGAGIQQYTKFVTYSFAKFITNALQDCWPERLKGIHLVNEPYALQAVFSMVKLIGKRKLMERIHLHGSNLNSLHEHIPTSFLPHELGGTLGPMDSKEFKDYFYSQEEFIERINKYGILEKKK